MTPFVVESASTISIQYTRKESVRVSLRGMLRLIRVDTLRRVHNVGFLAGRLKCIFINVNYLYCCPEFLQE